MGKPLVDAFQSVMGAGARRERWERWLDQTNKEREIDTDKKPGYASAMANDMLDYGWEANAVAQQVKWLANAAKSSRVANVLGYITKSPKAAEALRGVVNMTGRVVPGPLKGPGAGKALLVGSHILDSSLTTFHSPKRGFNLNVKDNLKENAADRLREADAAWDEGALGMFSTGVDSFFKPYRTLNAAAHASYNLGQGLARDPRYQLGVSDKPKSSATPTAWLDYLEAARDLAGRIQDTDANMRQGMFYDPLYILGVADPRNAGEGW
jgi:hypothetical protein